MLESGEERTANECRGVSHRCRRRPPPWQVVGVPFADIGCVSYVFLSQGTLPKFHAAEKLVIDSFFNGLCTSGFVSICRGSFERNLDDCGVFWDSLWLILVALCLFLVTF